MLLLLAAACRQPQPPPLDAGVDAGCDLRVVATADIGPEGGTLESCSGAALVVPPEAVDTAETFSIEVADGGFVFAMSNGVLSRPVTLRLPASNGDVAYLDGDDVCGTVDGGVLSAEVVHLGNAHVAPRTGARTIWGVARVTSVLPGQISSSPPEFFKPPVVAYVQHGDGGFDAYDGGLFPDGTFRIPGVPPGLAYVSFGDVIATDACAVDFGLDRPGRADQNFSLNMLPATLSVDVAAMTPWQDGDAIAIVAPRANAWIRSFEPIDAGATELLASYRQNRYILPLIEGSKGDVATVLHFTACSNDAGFDYSCLLEAATLPSFTMQTGHATQVNGSFARFPGTLQTVSPSVDVASFRTFIVDAGVTLSVNTSQGFIALASGDISAGSPAPFSFRSTFPADTPLQLRVETLTWSYVQGMGIGVSLSNGQTEVVSLGTPVSARLGPVRNATVNGVDFLTPMNGTGITPTVAWDPPALGVPTRYRLLVQVSSQNNFRYWTVTTRETHVTLPPGIVTPGSVWGVEIHADNASAEGIYRGGLPAHDSSIASAAMTP